MSVNDPRHHRRSIRLPEYDYASEGAYYITICAKDRLCLFGDVINGEMALNEYGRIVEYEWLQTPKIRREIELDAYVVMPNHFHAIVIINDCDGDDPVGAHGRAPLPNARRLYRKPKSLGSLVAGFESTVTKQINRMRNTPGRKLWQRNYWEHVIRNERDMERIRQYIIENPLRWADDDENPMRNKFVAGK